MRVHQNTWGRLLQAQKGFGNETKMFGISIIFRGSGVDAGRYADKSWWFQCACTMVFPSEKWSRWSWHHYVMSWGSLTLQREGTIKRRALPNQGSTAIIWVFGYKAFGSINKPQTLYLGCLGASLGGSITRMHCITCLSIHMHQDLHWRTFS